MRVIHGMVSEKKMIYEIVEDDDDDEDRGRRRSISYQKPAQ